MTALAIVLSALAGLAAGFLVQRAATRFVPAAAGVPTVARVPERSAVPEGAAVGAHGSATFGVAGATENAATRSVSVRVPAAVTVAATAVLCGLAALRFGATWQLPAFLLLAVVGVLLAVIDLEHRLLPNRVLLPATAAAAVLLTGAAALTGSWARLGEAVGSAAILFVFFLVLALIAPSGLGMGDVKLAGLLGLYLGWVGPGTVAVGAVAGFAVQAVLALVLLVGRRVGAKGEIPFGPALLVGAALAIGWATHIGSAWFGATGRM